MYRYAEDRGGVLGGVAAGQGVPGAAGRRAVGGGGGGGRARAYSDDGGQRGGGGNGGGLSLAYNVHVFTPHLSCVLLLFTTTEAITLIAALYASSQVI